MTMCNMNRVARSDEPKENYRTLTALIGVVFGRSRQLVFSPPPPKKKRPKKTL